MKIFIGMETSGQLRRRFEGRGHHVISCDLLPAGDPGHVLQIMGLDEIAPRICNGSLHIQADVFAALGRLRDLGWWPDLAIFHPTCTYLTVSAEWAYKDPDFERYPGVGYHQRLRHGTLFGADRRAARQAAIKDWERIDALPILRKVAENPAKGALSKSFRRPDQVVHPYMFGDDASKETGFWLWGVEPVPVPPESEWVQPRLVARSMAMGASDRANGNKGPSLLPRWGNQTDTGQNRLTPSADRWQKRSETFPGIADALVGHLT